MDILFCSVFYNGVPTVCVFYEIWLMEKTDELTNKDELKAIAIRLKDLRKAKGYNNYEHIAYELGMSRSAYWRLEQGNNFEIKTLIKICIVLDLTLEEFFKGIELPKKKH